MNVLKEKSYTFAVELTQICFHIQKIQKEYNISNQLLRSSTSVGANIAEAEAAISRKDFIHKLGIANKEAYETRFWLSLSKDVKLITEARFNKLID